MTLPEIVKKIEPVEGGYDWPLGDRKIRVKNLLTGIAGEVLNWNGQDGPFRLEDLPNIENLETVTMSLFGLPYRDAVEKAKESWIPYISNNGKDDARRLVISGGTDKISVMTAELGSLEKNGNVIGINAAIESRELALLVPGDIAFGNSEAWRQVAEQKHNIETHPIGEGHINYNSHKLLQKALRSVHEPIPTDEELRLMITKIANDPDLVVQVYASDDETSLLMLYLKDRVNQIREAIGKRPIEKIKVDANSTEITRKLMSKGYLYPKPSEVKDLHVAEDSYESWLEAEGLQSPIAIEMGEDIPRMPGYHIPWDKDQEKFVFQVKNAVDLLKKRWGVPTAFFKITEGSDGAGSQKVDIQNGEDMDKLGRKLYENGLSYVVEPYVTYDKVEIQKEGIKEIRSVAPSVHIRGGKAYNTMLAQLFIMEKNPDGSQKETTEWGGHYYAPAKYVKEAFGKGEKILGISSEDYEKCTNGIRKIADIYGKAGLSRGGIDVAIGTIDTKWGPKRVCAFQDMNIRANGGETARGFGKLLEKELGEEKPFTTKVIKPKLGVGYEDVNQALRDVAQVLGINRKNIKLITTVAPGWRMFGVVADSPEDSLIDAVRIEEALRQKKLIR